MCVNNILILPIKPIAMTIRPLFGNKPQLLRKKLPRAITILHSVQSLPCISVPLLWHHSHSANNTLGLHLDGATKRFVWFTTKGATESRETAAPLSVRHHRAFRPAVFLMKLPTTHEIVVSTFWWFFQTKISKLPSLLSLFFLRIRTLTAPSFHCTHVYNDNKLSWSLSSTPWYLMRNLKPVLHFKNSMCM